MAKNGNGFKKFWRLGIPELYTEHFDINTDGELIVREGNYQYNIFNIVKKYGTSTEIVFPTIIEERVRDIIDTFNAYIKVLGYKGKFAYHYAMKANQNKEYVLPAVAEGANLDVASYNELYLVKRMIEQERFNTKIRVICNGPKTPQYIALIEELKAKGLIVIPILENYDEIERFKKIKGDVGIRVNFNIRTGSHWDKTYNSFGFTEDELLKIGKIRNLSILHYHVSSQVESISGILAPFKRALHIYAKMREKNPGLDTLDIGGGACATYDKDKRYYTLRSLVHNIVRTAKQTSDRLGIRPPNLICEWGRYVSAPAQITVYRVLSSKPVERTRDMLWYVVDGSFMNDLLDTWAIKQLQHTVPVNGLHNKKLQKTWLTGSSCDSDDRYTGKKFLLLPRLDDQDELYLAFFDTGAYHDALASHHCLLSSPAKLIANNGEIKVIRRRETAEEVGKEFGW